MCAYRTRDLSPSVAYNSRDDRESGLLGKGWTFGFEGSSEYKPGWETIRLPNGSVMTFSRNSRGDFIAEDSRSTYDSYYQILTTKDQYTYGFNNNILWWIKDRNGNQINLTIDATTKRITKITDPAQRVFNLTYNSDGLIESITDPLGRVVRYEYENKKLVRAIDPMGKITRYSYDAKGYLAQIRDNDNNLIESIVYDTSAGDKNARVAQITDALGNSSTYTYDTEYRKLTVKDVNGRESATWYDSSLYPIQVQEPDGRRTMTLYSLDAKGINKFGEEKSVTDRNGNRTAYERDSRGNIVKMVNPDFSYKEFAYDEKNNRLWEKDENGKYTFYIYDTNKINLLKAARPLNGTDQYAPGCDESKFAITAYSYYTDTEAQQLGYQLKGLLKSETDPEGNITVYTYDAAGNLKTVTNPENAVTTYSYNQIGWKTGEVSPKLYQTAYVYDGNGRIEKTTRHGGEVTRITYDNMGRKTKEVSANLYNPAFDNLANHTYSGDHGSRYAYYPSGVVQSATDPENNRTAYTYDLYGNVLTETKPNNGVYQYDYDVLNRLTAVYFKENAAASPVALERYSYAIQANGSTWNTQKTHTRFISDTETMVTVYTYDYAGRLIRQDNPDGTYTATVYNANGTVASTTDARGNTTCYKYDGLNRQTEQWTPAENISGTIKYTYSGKVYDKVGRVKEEKTGKTTVALYGVPASFATTFYTYYRDGSLKTQSDSAGRKTEYQYDPDGYLSKQDVYIDATNKITTEYINNYFGKPTQEKLHVRQGDLSGQDFANNQDAVLSTTYTYDKNGNLKTETRPDHIVITYNYDNLDRQTGISMPGQDEFGSPVTISHTKRFNWTGSILTETDANNHTTTYTYDQRGFLSKVTDAKGKVAASYYDRAGRVIAEVSPNHYDPAKTLDQMNRTEYTYDQMSRIKTLAYKYMDPTTGQWAGYVAKAYKYDANGNNVKELDALGYEAGTGTAAEDKINSGYGTEYTYNLDGKLLTVLDPENKDRALAYTTKYEYDGLGRKTKETDANGNYTDYTYDDGDNILMVKVNNQTVQTNTYDLADRLLTQKDGNNNTTNFEYNALGQIRKTTLPGDATIPGSNITYQYDELGHVKKKTHSAGIIDLYSYDNQGRELSHSQQKSDGTQLVTTTVKYDKAGNQRFVTDGNNAAQENLFDEVNRMTASKITVTNLNGTPLQQITTYGYDHNGNQTSQTDWKGNTYSNVYDPLNRLIQKIDPFNKTIEKLEYNHNSVQVKSYDALNKLTQYTYDKNNRLLSTIDPLNHTTSQTYDNAGNIKTKTDGRNKTTTFNYDTFNRLISVVNAKNETTSYTYDLNGNMLTQTDGKGNVTTFEYNVANKPIRKIDHGGRTGTPGNYTYTPSKVESYTYYADGNLATKVDRNGNSTTYTYDVHGRMLTQAAGSINISYTYDGNGNQLTITDSTGTTTRTYDQLNRVKTKIVPGIGTITFLYDDTAGLSPGNAGETSTDPKGNVTKKIFDKAGRLVNVTAGGQTTTYTYYDNGNKQSTQYPDGSSETYTYYDDNLLNTLVNKKANQTVIDTYSYTYDAARNQTSKTDGKGTTTYTYDDLNRLGSVSEPNGRTTTYTYDAGGNRATQTVVYQGNTDITTYTCNNQNRLTGTATTRNGVTTETNAYTYDNNGNQLTVSQTPYLNGVPQTAKITNSTYDRLNQLLTTSMPDGTTLNNTYNGEGIRVKKEINGQVAKYLYEGDQILLELDSAGNQTARNIWGTSLISRNVSGITAYYMYNGHGDVTALINSAGTILATYYYDAFGNIPESTGTINNPFKYAGYQHDQETGYYYLMSRYYDPVTARFISEDTYRGNPNDPLSLNLYTYCHNEPLMYTDPTGHIERPTPRKEVKPKKDTSRNQHNREAEIKRKKKEAEQKAKEEREKNEKSQKYLVKSGDNLTKIGKKYDVSVADILKVNKDIKDPTKIQVGQIINIPAKTENATNTLPNLDQKNTGDIKNQEMGKIGSTRGPEDNWAMSGYSEETGKNEIVAGLGLLTVKISKSKYPESAQHIEEAIRNGYPDEVTINRSGASANRAASLKGYTKVPGADLDEYPPAMFKEGGKGASVKPINSSDNRGAGASMGGQLRNYPDGTTVKVIVDDTDNKNKNDSNDDDNNSTGGGGTGLPIGGTVDDAGNVYDSRGNVVGYYDYEDNKTYFKNNSLIMMPTVSPSGGVNFNFDFNYFRLCPVR
ncbi:RHS repeat-associated core domain-containing protein [Candidatus Formimonas warabiya]|nr:RHS repeat-associated core domain-containing protein [Candidatus Formimonas warabiya]